MRSIGSDVNVRLPEQLFRSGGCLLEDSSYEDRVVGPTVEFLGHGCLYDVGDAVPHGLETPQERAEGLVALTLDGFEVPGFHRFFGKGMKVRDKPGTEVVLVVDAGMR
jgi:hypothetical protein